MTLAPRKKWQKKLRHRRKTVWKGVGRGGSGLHSSEAQNHAWGESGIPQPASMRALWKKPWLPKLSGFRTQGTSGPGRRKAMELRRLGA